MPTFKRKLVWLTIKHRNGHDAKRSVRADIVGGLALHQDINYEPKSKEDPYLFRISHIRTGMAIGPAMPESIARQMILIMAAGYDWSFTEPEQVPVGVDKYFYKQLKRILDVEEERRNSRRSATAS